MKKIKYFDYIYLHAVLFLYAIAMLLSKHASTYEFLSFKFIITYGIMIVFMGIYALLWQQILKKVPLSIAFANKSITVIWGMLFGLLIFHEQLSFTMMIGAVLIVVGILLVVKK